MTPPDHSLTYKSFKFRNIPHLIRMRYILRSLNKIEGYVKTYADVGCSNGYVTEIIRKHISPNQATGFDFVEQNLEKGMSSYPDIKFCVMNLNSLASGVGKFDLVTCFETLEHVGSVSTALDNIKDLMHEQSVALITVPVETGIVGAFKFLLKNFLYGDDFKELGGHGISKLEYFICVVAGKNIQKFRPKSVSFWGTHYGFDWRELQKLIETRFENVSVQRKFTTIFFEVGYRRNIL